MTLFKKSPPPRLRQPAGSLSEAFRRNNVVISRSQSQLLARQQSVTQRQQQKKRTEARQRIKTRAIIITLATLGGLFLWRLSITSVNVSAVKPYHPSSSQLTAYQDTIAKEYRAHTIFGQSWLLDDAAFKAAVIQKHPEIATITTTTRSPFSTQLGAALSFRRPVFTLTDASKTERYIDSAGVLFAANLDPAINSKSLVHIEDQSGAVLDAGTSVLTSSLVQFIGQLHNQLPPLYNNAPIARVVIPKSTREVQVQMAKSPYLIKFSSEREVGGVVGELGTLLAYMKAHDITPSSYIDLRIPNRAFYK